MVEKVSDFDIFNPETRANPQAAYAQMREIEPVYRVFGPRTGNPIWFITGYEEAVSALKNQAFGKDLWTGLKPDVYSRYGSPPDPQDMYAVVNRHLLNVDPPDHTRLRGLVHKAFTPRMVENLKPRIEQIAEDLLDKMQDSSEGDLISDYAFPIPITVIAEMLGVPVEDRDRFREWTQALVFEGDADRSDTAVMEFVGYMNAMIDERQAGKKDDILSALVHAEDDGETLDRLELLSMIFLLLVAGHETTVNLIGNGMLALLQHPDQHQKLKDDPGLIRPAVEEMLRYNGPVETSTNRFAFEDVEIGGRTIRTGDVVLVSLVGANRDPAEFDNPDKFDITREPNRHIAFGGGIHYCVGAPLARMEGTIAVNALLKRLPNLQLNADAASLEWNSSILLHGMKAMPVRY